MQQQKLRVITAIIAIPLFLLVIYLGGWFLGIALLFLAALGCAEYVRMLDRIRPENSFVWLLGGCAYIIFGFATFFAVRYHGWGILWLLLIIWATDIAAYEVGRRLGKTPLAPTISPNKTVEGSVAGTAVALIIGFIIGLTLVKVSVFGAILVPLLISAIGQAGDLLESRVKRMAGVKDSGSLLPGHGGVLDRFDSLLLASPFMWILLLIF